MKYPIWILMKLRVRKSNNNKSVGKKTTFDLSSWHNMRGVLDPKRPNMPKKWGTFNTNLDCGDQKVAPPQNFENRWKFQLFSKLFSIFILGLIFKSHLILSKNINLENHMKQCMLDSIPISISAFFHLSIQQLNLSASIKKIL